MIRTFLILSLMTFSNCAYAQVPEQVIKKDDTTITVITTTSKDITLFDAQTQIESKKRLVESLQLQINSINLQIDKLNNEILDLETNFQNVGISGIQ